MSSLKRRGNAGRLAIVLGVGVTVATADPARAQTSDTFYKDKAVRIMVGHSPGGSFDFYARLAADMLKKHLPGVASVVVENKPGAGGLVATAHFYAQAPRDGTMLAVFPEGIANTQVSEPGQAKWKVEEMAYIGSFAPVNNVFIRLKDTPIRDPREMKSRETTIGCSGVSSQSYQYPAMLKVLGGYKLKMVCGYPGSAEFLLALDKGEIEVVSNAWNSLRITHLDRIRKGEVVPILQAGLKRNREVAEVPLLQELVEDGVSRGVIEFATAGAGIGRALLAPPGLPAERIAFLRATFDRMVTDPEMVETARKRGLEVDPTSGAEVQKIIDRIITAPKDLIDKAAKAMAG